jgi:DNA-binding NarL/FixJ family response regulator
MGQPQRDQGVSATADTVKVVVHSPDPICSLGVLSVLDQEPGLTVLNEADRGKADVIVAVEEVVGSATLGWLRKVRNESSADKAPPCVLVADDYRAMNTATVVSSGVSIVLPRRELKLTQLGPAVLAASRGLAQLPPALQGDLLKQLQQVQRQVLEPNGLTMSGITAREQDILRLLADGLSTTAIATELAYSERTVKYTLYGLMARYKFSSRAHAVAYALRTGVV